ncbi:MAG: hypothetical protein HY606_00250 [Planctomycetes bacterium]|nr:hypothetical protein [Planctomycetota bacterium]
MVFVFSLICLDTVRSQDVTGGGSATNDIIVNPGKWYQSITGFGAFHFDGNDLHFSARVLNLEEGANLRYKIDYKTGYNFYGKNTIENSCAVQIAAVVKLNVKKSISLKEKGKDGETIQIEITVEKIRVDFYSDKESDQIIGYIDSEKKDWKFDDRWKRIKDAKVIFYVNHAGYIIKKEGTNDNDTLLKAFQSVLGIESILNIPVTTRTLGSASEGNEMRSGELTLFAPNADLNVKDRWGGKRLRRYKLNHAPLKDGECDCKLNPEGGTDYFSGIQSEKIDLRKDSDIVMPEEPDIKFEGGIHTNINKGKIISTHLFARGKAKDTKTDTGIEIFWDYCVVHIE